MQGTVTIRRETDAGLINRIANDPAVLPFIARHGEAIDLTPAIEAEGKCLFLSNGEDAVMALDRFGERVWQVSTMFAASCRGKRAVETGLAMRDWMIPAHADLIYGSIPNKLRHAQWFYSQLGGERAESVEIDGETWAAQPDETLFVFRGNA